MKLFRKIFIINNNIYNKTNIYLIILFNMKSPISKKSISKFMEIPFIKNSWLSKILPKTGKVADSPGVIKYIWKKIDTKVKINFLNYNETESTEKIIKSINEIKEYDNQKSIKWINVIWVHNEAIIHEIGEQYNIHPLVLWDVTNTTQRPKIEEYDNYIFVIAKIISFSVKKHEIIIEQISLIIWKDYIISFQENESDVFKWIKERISNKKWKISKLWSDYLMYAILDAIVDQYFIVLEQISEKMEELEDQLLFSTDQKLLNKIYSIKKEIVYLKKSIWPIREVIATMQNNENHLIKKNTHIYLKDLYNHTIQVIETVETFRDLTSGMLDLYLSTISNKMNQVMKVLTIFSAIFIPLTFLAWVYGMNFKYMPELSMKWTYPAWWGFCIFVTIVMLIVFKKKKWL